LAAVLALPAIAGAAPSRPFTQCVPVGADTSCETLIVVNSAGELEGFTDPTQEPFDKIEDTLIGVVNESSKPVPSIKISGTDIFGFDGDGICSGAFSPQPPECPYGSTGYEGPGTSFEAANENEGNVNFSGEGLQPGASTYFSLEENVNLSCSGGECKAKQATELTTSLSGEGQTGGSVTVKSGASVMDSATLSGEGASTAGGTVTYSVYSDSTCTTLAAEAGTVTVTGGSVPDSSAVMLTKAGTYFWQAVYSGDENNNAAKSTCGSEVETVIEEPPPPACTKAAGSALIGTKGVRDKISESVSTNLAEPQMFQFSWEFGHQQLVLTKLLQAGCVKDSHGNLIFAGRGNAEVNEMPGFKVVFFLKMKPNGEVAVFVLVKKKAMTIHVSRDHVLTGESVS
jgi:hypothetical protein